MTSLKKTILSLILLVGLIAPRVIFAHCEIPCGIYTDEMRFEMMKEDIRTIEKSMKLIMELSDAGEPNYNQLVRWIENKETHADKISDTVTRYFLKQRVKPADMADKKAYNAYIQQLTLLHQIMVNSMKCKQSTDLEYVEKLKELVDQFEKAYLGEDE